MYQSTSNRDSGLPRAGNATLILTELFVGMAIAIGLATTAYADGPYGNWIRPSTGTQVSFYNCSDKLCGKIVAVKDQNRKSEIGTVIMSGANKISSNEWRGALLDTDNGKTYSGVVTLEGEDGLNLKGCVGIICQGETWRRVK
jgi:uncharacterized protein (DUF2147 family)